MERNRRMEIVHWLILSQVIAGLLGGCGKNDASAASLSNVGSTASSDTAAIASSAVTSDAELPGPVVAFRAKRDACDHFRGEEPYDAKRAAFLASEMVRQCKGTDQALADLRKRYAHNARVMTVLKNYQDKIE